MQPVKQDLVTKDTDACVLKVTMEITVNSLRKDLQKARKTINDL